MIDLHPEIKKFYEARGEITKINNLFYLKYGSRRTLIAWHKENILYHLGLFGKFNEFCTENYMLRLIKLKAFL